MNQQDSQFSSNQLFLSVILMVAGAHLCNDLIQSMLTATYPLLEEKYRLSFAQVGCISLVYQLTASILQPAIGYYTDKHPKPYLLPLGMVSTTFGLCMLGFASQFYLLLLAAAFLGVGSSTFHPEASRVARNASAGRFGLAQSAFQVGGNLGSSLGPLLVSLVVLRYNRQSNILWFIVIGVIAILLLCRISAWSTRHLAANKHKAAANCTLPYDKSKTVLACVAIGTFVGGPVGDRIGRKYVIWFSILGAAPFTLALPYANLWGTALLSCLIGLIISSAFSAIVVYAQELIPGRVGMIAGLFFGFMFGMSGIAAAVLGYVADKTSLQLIFKFCSFLPLLGILTILLPNVEW